MEPGSRPSVPTSLAPTRGGHDGEIPGREYRDGVVAGPRTPEKVELRLLISKCHPSDRRDW